MGKIRITVRVRKLRRYDEGRLSWQHELRDHGRPSVRDNRRLYLSDKEANVSTDRIEGKCQVMQVDQIKDLDAYKDQADTFWTDCQEGRDSSGEIKYSPLMAGDLRQSRGTQQEIAERKQLLEKFHASTKPLQTLELFAGCGGLSQGLKDSGAAETKWAVEFGPAAVRIRFSAF